MNETAIHYMAKGFLTEIGVEDDLSGETNQIISAINKSIEGIDFNSDHEKSGTAIAIFQKICGEIYEGILSGDLNVYENAMAAISKHHFADQARAIAEGKIQ